MRGILLFIGFVALTVESPALTVIGPNGAVVSDQLTAGQLAQLQQYTSFSVDQVTMVRVDGAGDLDIVQGRNGETVNVGTYRRGDLSPATSTQTTPTVISTPTLDGLVSNTDTLTSTTSTSSSSGNSVTLPSSTSIVTSTANEATGDMSGLFSTLSNTNVDLQTSTLPASGFAQYDIKTPKMTFAKADEIAARGSAGIQADENPLIFLTASGISWLRGVLLFATVVMGICMALAFQFSGDASQLISKLFPWFLCCGIGTIVGYVAW